jgi:hypothetical protein
MGQNGWKTRNEIPPPRKKTIRRWAAPRAHRAVEWSCLDDHEQGTEPPIEPLQNALLAWLGLQPSAGVPAKE